MIDSYYLDGQIRDDFTCAIPCYTHDTTASTLDTNLQCTHTYDHISQQLDSLTEAEQQQTLYTNEAEASLFTTDASTQCAFNITPSNLETESGKNMNYTLQNNIGIHFYSEHKYRDTFGDAHVQYHDFDNGDAFVYRDKYTVLLQELQNPYWCSHDLVTTKSYQISTDMDIQTMPHAMYSSGNTHTVTKINHVPYQTIQYNDKGMFPAQLMDDTPKQVFIDNGATPSILPLCTYKKHPIPQKYPKTKNTTPIHTGGGTIKSHFWIELPLKLDNQTIQIKS